MKVMTAERKKKLFTSARNIRSTRSIRIMVGHQVHPEAVQAVLEVQMVQEVLEVQMVLEVLEVPADQTEEEEVQEGQEVLMVLEDLEVPADQTQEVEVPEVPVVLMVEEVLEVLEVLEVQTEVEDQEVLVGPEVEEARRFPQNMVFNVLILRQWVPESSRRISMQTQNAVWRRLPNAVAIMQQ